MERKALAKMSDAEVFEVTSDGLGRAVGGVLVIQVDVDAERVQEGARIPVGERLRVDYAGAEPERSEASDKRQASVRRRSRRALLASQRV
jgi:hypothetical protein